MLTVTLATLPGCIVVPGSYPRHRVYYYEPYYYGPYLYAPFWFGGYYYHGDFGHEHGDHGGHR
jgi:hypothetical protein